jgi:hypothetical protein
VQVDKVVELCVAYFTQICGGGGPAAGGVVVGAEPSREPLTSSVVLEWAYMLATDFLELSPLKQTVVQRAVEGFTTFTVPELAGLPLDLLVQVTNSSPRPKGLCGVLRLCSCLSSYSVLSAIVKKEPSIPRRPPAALLLSSCS